jgi:hypothetical protein
MLEYGESLSGRAFHDLRGTLHPSLSLGASPLLSLMQEGYGSPFAAAQGKRANATTYPAVAPISVSFDLARLASSVPG